MLTPEQRQAQRDVFEAARRAIGLREGCTYDALIEGLDALRAKVAVLERDLDTAKDHLRGESALLRMADARVAALDAENVALKGPGGKGWAERAVRMEAKVAALEEALGKIEQRRESWYDAMGDDEAGAPNEEAEACWEIAIEALREVRGV